MNLKTEAEKNPFCDFRWQLKETDQKSIAVDNSIVDVWCNTSWKGPSEMS